MEAICILDSVPILLAAALTCAISGRVSDARGKPVPFAAVTATRLGLEALAMAQPAGGAAADQNGEFCIPVLPPGQYQVKAGARERPPSASPDCNECCAPGTEFGEASLQLSVPAGRRLEIRLPRVPAFCVRGEIRGADGALRPDAALAVSREGWSAGVENRQGRFLLTWLPAGVYELTVTAAPGRLAPLLAKKRIEIRTRNIAGLVIMVP